MANPITQVQVGGTTYDVKDAGAVRKVNGTSPDANGNVTVDAGGVKTVNGQQPDSAGNVQIETGSNTLPANAITAGTFAGQVVANATTVAALGTKQVRNIYAGTADLEAGVSPLPAGDIYIVYE